MIEWYFCKYSYNASFLCRNILLSSPSELIYQIVTITKNYQELLTFEWQNIYTFFLSLYILCMYMRHTATDLQNSIFFNAFYNLLHSAHVTCNFSKKLCIYFWYFEEYLKSNDSNLIKTVNNISTNGSIWVIKQDKLYEVT